MNQRIATLIFLFILPFIFGCQRSLHNISNDWPWNLEYNNYFSVVDELTKESIAGNESSLKDLFYLTLIEDTDRAEYLADKIMKVYDNNQKLFGRTYYKMPYSVRLSVEGFLEKEKVVVDAKSGTITKP